MNAQPSWGEPPGQYSPRPPTADQAVEILARAQQYADHVTAEAAEAANRMRLEADAESRRLLRAAEADVAARVRDIASRESEINRLHALARVAADDAERRRRDTNLALTSARDEARTIVEDAAEQASLTLESADRTGSEMLAEAEAEALRVRERSQTEADQRLAASLAEHHRALAAARDVTAMTLELAAQRADEQRQVLLDQRLAQHARAQQREAELSQRLEDLLSQAETDADQHRALAQADVERTRRILLAERDAVTTELQALRDQAQEQSAAKMAEADQQIAWARQAVEDLLAAAEAESTRLRERGVHAGQQEVSLARQQAREILEEAEAERKVRAAQHEQVMAQLTREAEDALRSAHLEADAHWAKVADEADQLAEEAAERERIAAERADRRLADAEAGARSLRERAADNLSKAQVEAHALKRDARAETSQSLDSARAEADRLRAQARQLLDDARSEVSALADRRAAIERELGNLSGVIEALAVPDSFEDLAQATANSPPASDAIPVDVSVHVDPLTTSEV